jgi:hypothetical protein
MANYSLYTFSKLGGINLMGSRISRSVGAAFGAVGIFMWTAGIGLAASNPPQNLKEHRQRNGHGLHGDLRFMDASEAKGPVSRTVCSLDPMALRGHDGECGINETMAKTYCQTCEPAKGPASCTVVPGACKSGN